MEINDNQRRKVAKKMREYDVAEFKESAIVPFLECLGHGYMNWRGILDELADLIDRPTCKNLATHLVDELVCSACGERVDIAYLDKDDDYRVRYCPSCGAKVVE